MALRLPGAVPLLGSLGYWNLVLICDLVLGIWNFSSTSNVELQTANLIYTHPSLW
jgi:hypothetical protein